MQNSFARRGGLGNEIGHDFHTGHIDVGVIDVEPMIRKVELAVDNEINADQLRMTQFLRRLRDPVRNIDAAYVPNEFIQRRGVD